MTGVKNDNADVSKAMADDKDAIKALLKCGDNDVRITPRLIESLLSVVAANGMKSYTSSC